jgi:uncharacterized protein YbjT (DUF2867 family)
MAEREDPVLVLGATGQQGGAAARVESKARIEEHIRALGLPATILRPVSFLDNFASINRPVLTGGGLCALPAGADRATARV